VAGPAANKRITFGVLAHVDAGKTTLSEAILFRSGVIRAMGRVDRGSTALDTHDLERRRGITIFAAGAVFPWGDAEFTLLDTPGHVDFSAETERVLPVLDYYFGCRSSTTAAEAEGLRSQHHVFAGDGAVDHPVFRRAGKGAL